MTSKSTILEHFAHYLELFPNEKEETDIFAGYLARNANEELYNRKNFDGHITTSAFIVNMDRMEMLLLKHKSLNRWLQPGGHVETGDTSLLASAYREAEEETGIGTDLLEHLALVPQTGEMPFDIDSHYIPANPKKQEDGHYHHDIRYLFRYKGDGIHNYNPDEATGLRWVSFEELKNDDTFGAMIAKINKAIPVL